MGALDYLLGILAPPFCWACGATALPRSPLCWRCRARVRRLAPEPVVLGGVETWAPVAYDGPTRAVVAALKFRGAGGLAEPIAVQIVASAPRRLLTPGAALVPVPLHPSRRRTRGFNQAELIAAGVARRSGMGVADCLRRSGSRETQVGRSRAVRLAGVEDAITLATEARPPRRAVLVDDVVTTGATLAACADALRAAGTADVRALAYALTPGR